VKSVKYGWVAVVTLVLACGGSSKDSEGGSETAGGTEATETAVTTGSNSQAPSGQSCPLVGFFVACEGGGQTFCDQIDGALRFGPCVDPPACDISGSASCDGHCELVEGVPTFVPDEGCFTSSVETDSG
jgi:hypothetical protein